mgnify:CR=1 FL=1
MKKRRERLNDRHFQTRSPQQLSWHDRLRAHRLYAGGNGHLFCCLNLGYGLTDFGYYTLYRTTFVLLLYIPVLTMRSFAEERRTRTDQLLLTSVSVWEIVLGKFFACASSLHCRALPMRS